jgi:hypothetical protein
MKGFIRYIIAKMKCQRGEVGTDIDSSVIGDAVFMADIDEGDTPEIATEEPGEETPAEEEPDEIEEEEEETVSKITELEQELAKAQKEINRLGYSLRKKEEKAEPKETPLTKHQLLNILKEHQDDPEIVFQVMEEMSKQGKVDAQEAAEKSMDIKRKKEETAAHIKSLYPDALDDGTPLNNSIQAVVEWAHLDGHPMAQEAALGMLLLKNFPDTIREIRELAKKEAEELHSKDLKDKNEASRKKGIAAAKPAKSGSSDAGKPASLTQEQMETAKSLGLKTPEQLKRYAKLLGAKEG